MCPLGTGDCPVAGDLRIPGLRTPLVAVDVLLPPDQQRASKNITTGQMNILLFFFTLAVVISLEDTPQISQ